MRLGRRQPQAVQRVQGAVMGKVSDRELDRRLHDAVMHLAYEQTPRLAQAVKEARARLFPLHCAACGELPHKDDDSHCPELRRQRQSREGR